MFLAAIFGVIGTLKQSSILLLIYSGIIWSLFIGFWVVFAIFLKHKARFEQQIVDLCRNRVASGFMSTLQKAYPNDLATSFCTQDCPCKTDATKFPTTTEYASAVFSPTGASSILACPKSVYQGELPSKEASKFLSELEERYACSGLCTREKWFYFSDVGMGAPLYSCQRSISDYLNEKFIMIYGVVLTCTIITFFAPVPAIVFLCLKSRRVFFLLVIAKI